MGADESGPEVRAEPFGQAAIRPTPDSPVSEEQRGKTVRTDEQTSDSERAREGDKLRLGSDLVTYVLRRVVPVPVPFPATWKADTERYGQSNRCLLTRFRGHLECETSVKEASSMTSSARSKVTVCFRLVYKRFVVTRRHLQQPEAVVQA